MDMIRKLEKQRERVLDQMRSIRFMERGSINEQFFPAIRNGKKTQERRGPYYVLSRNEGCRTVSRRLKGGAELQQAREAVARHKEFLGLCKEFEVLTERLGKLQREQEALEKEKKRCRSPSNKTRK